MAFDSTREGQMTEQKLGFGYWWVTHKLQVRRYFSIFLAVVAVPLLAYGAYGFADWYFGSGVAERAQSALMSKSVINYSAFREKNSPRDLRLDSPQVISAGEKSYDLIGRVQNPNLNWWADIEYHFDAGSVSPTGRIFVLPGESKTIAALAVKSDSRPGISKVVIDKTNWHRVDLHETRPDYATWSNARLALKVTDATFTAPAADEAVKVNRATFTITNESGFSYRNGGFFVTLLSGTKVVAVSKVTISDLRAGETRAVDASWFYALPSVTKVDVKPLVNIFDVQSYIAPGR